MKISIIFFEENCPGQWSMSRCNHFEILCIESKKVKLAKKKSSESKAFHSALVNAVEAFKYIHKKTKKPHYQLHPDQTWIGMHYAHHRSLLERARACVRVRRTVGQIPPKCKETSKLDVIVIDMFCFSFICLLKLLLYNRKPQNQMCD